MAYTRKEREKHPLLMDRILLRMGKDQYEIAKLLEKELDRVTERYKTAQRTYDSRNDPRQTKVSEQVLSEDVRYWRGQKNMTCYIAEDIAQYFQDKAKGYPTKEYQHANISQEYSAFLQKVGCAD